MAWVTQMMNQWVAIEIAYNNGMVPVATYEVIFDDQRRFIGTKSRIRQAEADRPESRHEPQE